MGDEQNNTLLRKHKNTQNLNEKSNVLRSVFALHNRHISSGSIKEVINSKPNVKSFETFKDIIDELPIDDPRFRNPCIEIAKNKLEWFPKTGLSEGLDKTISFFKV